MEEEREQTEGDTESETITKCVCKRVCVCVKMKAYRMFRNTGFYGSRVL